MDARWPPRRTRLVTGAVAGLGLALLLLSFAFDEHLIDSDGEGNTEVRPLGAVLLLVAPLLLGVGWIGARSVPNGLAALAAAAAFFLLGAALPASDAWIGKDFLDPPGLWSLLAALAFATTNATVRDPRVRRVVGVLVLAAIIATTLVTWVYWRPCCDPGSAFYVWIVLAGPFLPLLGDAAWAWQRA